jgi:hypothetical protein
LFILLHCLISILVILREDHAESGVYSTKDNCMN